MTSQLRVEGLRVAFQVGGLLQAVLAPSKPRLVEAVADVSLSVVPGETLGLVGESGSGKTTTARAILGLVPSQSGSIQIDGRELLGAAEAVFRDARRSIGFMFQDAAASLSPRKRVEALVTEPYLIHGMRGVDRGAEARRLIREVGLGEQHLRAFPHQLSGGQARRVALARTLALKPKFVIADEPTAGLDVSIQGDVINLLNGLQREFGLGYIVVTHNLPLIRHASHRLAIMYLGRIVEQGPTAAVYQRPAHPYTRALIDAVAQLDPTKRSERVRLAGEAPSLFERPPGCEFHPRCLSARDRCRSEAPALSATSDDRQVRCHFPLE